MAKVEFGGRELSREEVRETTRGDWIRWADFMVVGGGLSLYTPDGADGWGPWRILQFYNGPGNSYGEELPREITYEEVLDRLIAYVKEDGKGG